MNLPSARGNSASLLGTSILANQVMDIGTEFITKEQEIIEKAEQVQANGQAIIGLLYICMKLEAVGVQEIQSIVH